MTTDQDYNRNPTGKGGFADNPQHRNPGGWKKENTARYKLEKLMKMAEQELNEFIDDLEAPTFDRNMALAVKRGEWKELESMINQVYGKPKESVDISNPDGSLTPKVALVEFVDGKDKRTDT